MSWTDERIEQLKSLWTDGLSASHIAKVMGGGVSRNAVIGKVHRLGLAGRALAPRTERIRVHSAARHSGRVHLPEPPIVEEDPIVLEDGSFATVLTINDRMCRWPIGDPSENAFHFCGRNPKHGSPYCDAHSRKAFQPHQLRPEKRRLAG
jgi:GcrA cell cycle regulator